MQQIKVNASIDNPTIMVLGNKRDLEAKEVTDKEIEEFQANHRDVVFSEVSARTGLLIMESFRTLGLKMLDKGHQVQVSGFQIPGASERSPSKKSQRRGSNKNNLGYSSMIPVNNGVCC